MFYLPTLAEKQIIPIKKFIQYPKQEFFVFQQPWVCSLHVSNFGHFQPHLLIKEVLVENNEQRVYEVSSGSYFQINMLYIV